ncbi:MAG: restriction endonuclease subunit S [Paracoccus marcusii]
MKLRPLDDVATFFSGFAWKANRFQDNPSGVPIIRIQNVGSNNQREFKYWPDAFDDRFIIVDGDLLLTLSGSFRTAVWNGPRALLNQRIVKVMPKSHVDRDWLFYALENAMSRISGMGRHALVSNVALSDLKEMQIAVPPLEEQKRIAAILDQADAVRRLRRRALDRLNTLGQAVFAGTFGNTAHNDMQWPTVKVGDVTDCIVPGRNKPRSFTGDIPWITTADLVHLGETSRAESNQGLTIEEAEDAGARIIPKGSVLITCAGDLGVATIAKDEMVINQQLHSFQCGPAILPKFLVRALATQKQWMLRRATQTTLPYMNKSICNSIPIRLPPISVQEEFSRRMGVLEDKMMLNKAAASLSENFFTSLQHRAFRGEL